MKKIIIISSILTASAFVFGAAHSKTGDWNDVNTWDTGVIPTTEGVDIMSGTTVTVSKDTTYSASMFTKSNSNLVFENGTFTTIGGINAGSDLTFLGGTLSISGRLDQSSGAGFVFGGVDSEGNFKEAVAKSVDATNRLMMISDSTATYNVGASNLITSKSTGLDENAFIYTTGEIQLIQCEFLFDFSNILISDLQNVGITESGTYYLALASYGSTYRFTQFDLSKVSSTDTDLVSFEGFEWANPAGGNGANTLYAVLNVSVPEPSTYAMIFGALALAFVAYRRRK